MAIKGVRGNTVSLSDLILRLPGAVKDLPKILTALYYNFTINPQSEISIGEIFNKTVSRYPNHTCILYQDQKWTYREFNNWVNRLANHFLHIGFKKGDVVAVLVENRPEILAISMAMAKIGGIAALLNTAQKHKPLIHSIRLANPKLILVGSELIDHFLEIRDELKETANQVQLVPHLTLKTPKIPAINEFDIQSSAFPLIEPKFNHKIYSRDAGLYIYTSGTTGLPKASIISHGRWIKGYSAFGLTSFRLSPEDILYVPLPFYHATAMVVCWTSVVAGGAAIVIKNKFSVKDFWHDIDHYKATGFGYVGEICKYLLNAPVHPLEKHNTLTRMIGNGLRPEIWKTFKNRFEIEQICEFYASSEGNIAFFNVFNIDETMGFSITSYAIVEYDQENDQPVLDRKGYMKKVNTHQTGLLLGEINERYPFDGYTERDKTEKSILRNVFKKGDAWFNTGDMVRDMGYFHTQFVDRLGDTFRWKGENVSTGEVEGIVNQFTGIEESIVYGVEIPDNSGRAGMVNIILKNDAGMFDLDAFYQYLNEELPTYAVPLFIRFSRHSDVTTTFKHQKYKLKKEGYDCAVIGDEVYVLMDKRYTAVSIELRDAINSGQYRF
ncbi:MAG: long-chain-acyl-CoA synthetase [Sphingobacteriales bacterium]|nr:long-chain-acyl-CoA synthetase [Sphingobacteriales bacterium]